MAYLRHPKAAVRRVTIGYVRDIRAVGVADELINLLGDSDPGVSRAAGAGLWERERDDSCTRVVKALRDEIRGSTSMGTTDGLVMGRQNGIRALDVLIESAPDDQARTAVKDLAEREIIIEERIKEVDTDAVQFVGQEQRKQYTYEIHRAPNREQALTFLKSRRVTKQLHYIEVETPVGTFGRDLNGIYW